jgi:hypothetical protein
VQTTVNGVTNWTFQANPLTLTLSAVFFVISAFFVYRSFYGMRIESGVKSEVAASTPTKAAA